MSDFCTIKNKNCEGGSAPTDLIARIEAIKASLDAVDRLLIEMRNDIRSLNEYCEELDTRVTALEGAGT